MPAGSIAQQGSAFELAACRQLSINQAAWGAGGYVDDYSGRSLEPPEIMILVRYRELLSGRTVELGCGAGRVLSYLVPLGGDVHGVDLAPDMVEYCRRQYPRAEVRVGDLTDPASYGQPPFDVILALNNLIDVLPDAERRRVLGATRSKLTSNGLLIFSSHNLGRFDLDTSRAGQPQGWRSRGRRLVERARARPLDKLARLPGRIRNRRRMRALEYRGDGYAVINDEAHDYSLLHYYIRRDDQERQLREVGYELIECLDGNGNVLFPGQPSASTSLHYVARLDPAWVAARELRAGHVNRQEP